MPEGLKQSIKTLNFQEIKPAGSTLLFVKTNERILGEEHFFSFSTAVLLKGSCLILSLITIM